MAHAQTFSDFHYLCQVVKKPDGVVTQELQGIAFKDHADAYHEQCKMRW
jgi:hypothetical protein